MRARKITLSLLLALAAAQLGAHGQNVLTWHNDIGRTGRNTAERTLTLTNVNAQAFGKVGFFSTDGKVDGQPLYVQGVQIGGIAHNVLYVVSEHDSVYAFDAQSGAVLWQVSLLNGGETTATNGCDQIAPEIGITSTPVIDLTQGPNGAMYVVNMAKGASYHQRLHALDLATGADLFGGPTEIQATYPGAGDNSVNGKVVFAPGQYAERAALLEWNGSIYTGWTSHCDGRPYTGWIMAYDASTLQQTSVLNVTPNGNSGSIWMSGAGLAATSTGIFFLDANGTFDTTLDSNGFPSNKDFGNAFIQLSQTGSGLQVSDYYATDTTVQQSNGDIDLGSGGVLALPTIYDNAGNRHYFAIGAGKDTNIYLVNRFSMGKYHPNGGSIYQVLSGALPQGEYSAPAYFDSKIYYGGLYDNLRVFGFSNAQLISTPLSRSSASFGYPGATPSISSNGLNNGIVWAVKSSSPAVLYAFNAEDLTQELYNSNQSGTRDQFGPGNKFVTPTVANAHVYVGTQTGVAVFGLLGN